MPQRDVLPRRIRVSFDEAFIRRILLQIQRRASQPPRPHHPHLMGFERRISKYMGRIWQLVGEVAHNPNLLAIKVENMTGY
jgi:hypothetical protein